MPTRAAFLVVPKFNMGSLVGLIEVMRVANYLTSGTLYEWRLLSFEGPEVVASNGLGVTTADPQANATYADIVFVLGSWNAEHYDNRAAFSWLRRQARRGTRICAVELGCYLVAKAGLYSTRPMTTHWSWMPGFKERFDEVPVIEQLYTVDGPVMSCAGSMAAVDMMLTLVAAEHGEQLAGEVVDQLCYISPRPPEAPQRQTLGREPDKVRPLVRKAISLIEEDVAELTPIPEIARQVGLSQRQLERLFKKEVGCSIAQFRVLVRLQHARVLLISTSLSVREIATAAGFNTLSYFASSFRRYFGRRPSEYRQGWSDADPFPSWPGTLSKFLGVLNERSPVRAGAGALKSGAGRTSRAAMPPTPGEGSGGRARGQTRPEGSS
ncbi:MAG: GlxA family transcriptional regulator [Hyphomicrobiales bacterium]